MDWPSKLSKATKSTWPLRSKWRNSRSNSPLMRQKSRVTSRTNSGSLLRIHLDIVFRGLLQAVFEAHVSTGPANHQAFRAGGLRLPAGTGNQGGRGRMCPVSGARSGVAQAPFFCHYVFFRLASVAMAGAEHAPFLLVHRPCFFEGDGWAAEGEGGVPIVLRRGASICFSFSNMFDLNVLGGHWSRVPPLFRLSARIAYARVSPPGGRWRQVLASVSLDTRCDMPHDTPLPVVAAFCCARIRLDAFLRRATASPPGDKSRTSSYTRLMDFTRGAV